jgi:GDPmannose 4,6-dehydratase
MKLGTLEPKRDWGYAGDYVEAMHMMLQHETADDFVIATGETHSVGEFAELAFQVAGIENGLEKFVKIDDNFKRPSEVDLLIGDSSKARELLGWKPKVSFEDLVRLMVEHDLNLEKNSIA